MTALTKIEQSKTSFIDIYKAVHKCSRQNRYAGCSNLDNKFTTSTTLKKGYVTIFRRR